MFLQNFVSGQHPKFMYCTTKVFRYRQPQPTYEKYSAFCGNCNEKYKLKKKNFPPFIKLDLVKFQKRLNWSPGNIDLEYFHTWTALSFFDFYFCSIYDRIINNQSRGCENRRWILTNTWPIVRSFPPMVESTNFTIFSFFPVTLRTMQIAHSSCVVNKPRSSFRAYGMPGAFHVPMRRSIQRWTNVSNRIVWNKKFTKKNNNEETIKRQETSMKIYRNIKIKYIYVPLPNKRD